MASDHSEYQIQIKTTSDPSAIKQTTGALDEATAAANKAGKSIDDAGEGTAKAGDKFNEAKSHVKESGEQFEVHSEKARLLREMLHLVGPELEAIGEATHFLESPITIAIGVALVAFSKFRESIAETNKKLDEMAEEASKPIGKMLEDIATAAEHAADAQNKFNAALHATSEAESKIAKDLANRISLYNEEIDLIAKVTKAREEAALKQIALDLATGALTPDQGNARRASIEAQGQRAADQSDRAKAVHEIEATKDALKAAEKEKAGISTADLISQRKAAETEKGNKESSKEGLAADTKTRQAALDEAIKKYESALQTYHGYEMKPGDQGYNPNNPAPGALGQGAKRNMDDAQREMEDAAAARDRAKQGEKSNQAAEDRLKAQIGDLTSKIEKRTAREQELSNLIEQYKEALEKAKAALELRDKYQPMIDRAREGHAEPMSRGAAGNAPDHGSVNPFATQAQTSIAQADAAIGRASAAHGQHGTLPVLIDKLTHITALLNRAHAGADGGNETAALEAAFQRLVNEVSKLEDKVLDMGTSVSNLKSQSEYGFGSSQ